MKMYAKKTICTITLALMIVVVLQSGIFAQAAVGGGQRGTSGTATNSGVDPNSEIQPKLSMAVWPGVAPGSENWTQTETVTNRGTIRIANVSKPEIFVYLPEASKATGTCVVVAPGGGFSYLTLEKEGHAVARWLVERGIAAVVLKYRCGESTGGNRGAPAGAGAGGGRGGAGAGGVDTSMDGRGKYGIADGIQAIKVIREHAAEWGISPNRVGIVGFSAGAMVASGTVLLADTDARPNFAAPIYGGPFGVMPQIPANLPPIFLAWAQDDGLAGRSSLAFYEALKAAGYQTELHIFSAGGHGFGIIQQGTSSDHWIDAFYYWMEANGWTKRAQ
jgi:acetyl esterase/lipase